MPSLGEVKRGKDIGRRPNNWGKYVWVGCETCGSPRWVHLIKGEPSRKNCGSCASKIRADGRYRRENNINWQGGKSIKGGYVHINIEEDSFFAPMRNMRGYVPEHRLIIAQSLGRCLHSGEIVHHLNRNKVDNRIENLELVSLDEHKIITILENKIRDLEQRIKELEQR